MKKKILTTALCLAMLPLFTQCASQQEVQTLQYQLRLMNKKLEDVKNDTNTQIQQRQAVSSSQMGQLEQEVMVLKNQLEETNEINRRLKEHNNTLSSTTQQESLKREQAIRELQQGQDLKEERLVALNKKLAEQDKNLKAIQQARLRDAETRAKNATAAAQTAKNKSKALSSGKVPFIKATKKKIIRTTGVTKKAPVKSTVQKVTPQPTPQPKTVVKVSKAQNTVATGAELLSQAQKEFDSKKYSAAYTSYENIARERYNEETTIKALYMMGESRFQQKEYDAAVVKYQDVIRKYPNNPLSISALLRQATSFDLLKEKETAQMLFKKVIEKYPNSPEAKTAQKQLDK